MDILRKKDLKLDFSSDVLDIIDLMDLTNNISLVGSMNLKSMIYANDYDCYEEIKTKKLEYVYEKWKINIMDLLQKKDVYIGDIKCGVDLENIPLRWKPKDILDGKLRQFNLIDCMNSGNMWKMDIIALINGVFKEFSCVYEVQGRTKIKGNMLNSLKNDAKEKYKEGNYFKCIKRIFSIANYTHNDKLVKYIYPFLTGDLGLISTVISDIGTIKYLLENIQNLDTKRINYEIDGFKQRLGNVYKTNSFFKKQKQIVNLINKIETEKYQLEDIAKLEKILNSILTNSTKPIFNNKLLRIFI